MHRKRGELVPIGDAVSGLRSPVTTKPKTKLRDPSTVHLVTASAVTFAPSLWTVTVTKRGPSWWNRLRKQPCVDWIVKLMARILVNKLFERVFERVLDLFLRVRTASDAHGRSHAA